MSSLSIPSSVPRLRGPRVLGTAGEGRVQSLSCISGCRKQTLFSVGLLFPLTFVLTHFSRLATQSKNIAQRAAKKSSQTDIFSSSHSMLLSQNPIPILRNLCTFMSFFFFLITEVYVPKSNRKRSHSYGAAWERCLSHGKTQCASQNPMAFPERDGKAGSCVSQCCGFCILGVLRASWRAEAWQAAVGGLHHSCGFYAEDEGASEITAVPGSRMHRVISQL